MKTRLLTIFLALWMVPRPGDAQNVRVNEAQSANRATILDEDGDAPDWIELYNASGSAIDLTGFGLSDDPDEPLRWVFPAVEIGAGDFLLVFASGKDRAGISGRWESVARPGDHWRYIPGSGAITLNWMEPGFDDAAWSQGPSGFGFGDGDDATQVPGALSVLARFRFDVPDRSLVSDAEFHIDFDDGYVAFLNGTELSRANMGDGQTYPNQSATASQEALLKQGLDLTGVRVDPALFVDGTNVLAVQVSNVSQGSSDLSMIPILSVEFQDGPASTAGVTSEVEIVRERHTGFRLAAGETLCLSNPEGVALSCLELPEAPDDVSVGVDPGGQVGLFADPTPGRPNVATGASGTAPEVIANPPTGRYSGFQIVGLSTTGDVPVHYTLDGSEPGASSPRYEGPLRLEATTVLRARAVADGLLPGEVETHTYLFEDHGELPVISIAVDPEAMFDPVTGLYARGPRAEGSFPYFGANFWSETELPVHAALIEPGGSGGLSVGAGLSIYGGWSRGHAQKSFALFARRQYGSGEFQYRLFSDRAYNSFESVVLRNSGNDWDQSMLRDGFMQTLVRDTEIDRLAYRPAVVYINGEYWGIQNLREKINEHYVAAIGGADPDGIDLLEFSDGENGATAIHGTTEVWQQALARMGQSDIATPAALRELGDLIDLESFIDYQLAQIYFDNRDWPGNNSKAWRPRTEDGTIRWILYDTDFGWGLWDDGAWSSNTLQFAIEPNGPGWPNPPWATYPLRRLLENPDFVQAFVTRLADLVNEQFDVDRVRGLLSDVAGAIAGEIPRQAARWGALSPSGWNSEISSMHQYASRRPSMVLGHFQSEFGLDGLSRIQVEAGVGGRVKVNRLLLEGSWGGSYWNGVPLTITAVPDPGYRFAGWTGSAESTRVLTVDPADGVALAASFEPDPGASSAIVIQEIQYNTPAGTGDWVELVNAGQLPVGLAGWQFADEGDAYTLPAHTLEPGGMVVLCENPEAFQSFYGSSCLGPWTFRLANGGEALRLLDSAGVTADSVTYGDSAPWPSEPDGGGQTLSLVDPLSDNADPGSWRPSRFAGGTPGGPNAVFTATEEAALPIRFAVSVYPQPAAGPFRIELSLGEPAPVEVALYDLLGRRVLDLGTEDRGAGRHVIEVHPTDLAGGMYFVVVEAGGRPVHRSSLVLVR